MSGAQAQAQHTTPPSLTLASVPQSGGVLATITAVAPDSGLRSIFYSLDGRLFQHYTGTLGINTAQAPILYAFAEDNNGNRGFAQWALVAPVATATATDTATPTTTATPSSTATASVTPTATASLTTTLVPTVTPTATGGPTQTATPTPVPAGFSASPVRAPAGTTPTYTLSGGGFQAGEQVAISGGPFESFGITADSAGAFTVQRQANPDVTGAGVQTITALGLSSGARYQFNVVFTRLDINNQSDSQSASYLGIARGRSASLTLNAWGFCCGEAISIVSQPAGLFADLGVVQQFNPGDLVHLCCPSLSTSPSAPAGVYNIVVSGLSSGIQLTRAFNVIDLSVSPEQVQAGRHGPLVVTASGLTPNGWAYVSGGPFAARWASADADGRLRLAEAITAGAGRYTLSVLDTTTNGHALAPVYLSTVSFSNNPAWSDSGEYYFLRGFLPGEVVHLTADPGGALDSFDVTVDSNGEASDVYHPHSGIAAGRYTFTAHGRTSGYIATNVLVISSNHVLVSPSAGIYRRGQAFSVSASGFSPGEDVRITDTTRYNWLAFPSATSDTNADLVTADASGVVRTTLVDAGGAGRQDLQLHGLSSGIDQYGSTNITGIRLDWVRSTSAMTSRDVYFEGFGFQSGETVGLTSNPPGLFPPTSASTDYTGGFGTNVGNFGYTLKVGAVPAGVYQVIATGASTQSVAIDTFYVGDFGVSPAGVQTGVVTALTFSGGGYVPRESIDIWADGHEDFFADFSISADDSGSFTVTRPSTGRGGQGYPTQVHARGHSGFQRDFQLLRLSIDDGGDGSSFAFRGFVGPSENGTATLTSMPPGLFSPDSVTLSIASSNVLLSLPFNPSAPPGDYVLTARMDGSGVFASRRYRRDAPANGNPVLHLDTAPRLYTANAADTRTQSGTISLDNFGGATVLNWQAQAATGTTPSWLSLSRSTGSVCPNCSDQFQFQVDPSGRVPGVYHATITVAGQAGTINGPRVIPVTLTVEGTATASLTPNSAQAGAFPPVALAATGFDAGEVVDVTGGPWGNIVASADSTGRLGLQTQVTATGAGRYVVTVRGRTTGQLTTAAFSLIGVSSDPTTAQVGANSPLRLSGAGFSPGEPVSVTSDPDGLITPATTTADANGTFTLATVPLAAVLPGTYALVTRGTSGDTARATFTSTSGLGVSPPQASVRATQLTLTGAGFMAAEQVSITVATVLGEHAADSMVTADGSGRLNAMVPLRPDASDGRYIATARGRSSGRQLSGLFFQTAIQVDRALVPAAVPNSVRVSGHGFEPGEPVTLTSTPSGLFGSLPPVAADEAGDFATALTVNAPAGAYQLVAVGVRSGYTAAIALHVGALAITPVWQLVGAGNFAPLAINASGFGAGDVVHIGALPGWSAPFGRFDQFTDTSGTISLQRQVTDGSASRFLIQVSDDHGNATSLPYYQVHPWLDQVQGSAGHSNTFRLRGDGFPAFETIHVSASDARLFGPLTFFTTDNGSFPDVPITTSADAPSGSYQVTLRAASSGIAVNLTYQVGAFTIQPTQALAGQRPTVRLQVDGFAPRERVHVEGGPWNPFYALADDRGSIATTQDVFTPTAGRYVVAASGNSGAVGRTTFYLTGIVPGSSQITQGSGGRFFVAGAGFGEGEPVSLRTQPDGLFRSTLPASTDSTGAVLLAGMLDPTASAPRYTITVTGSRTGYQASASVALGALTASPTGLTRGSAGDAARVVLSGSGFQANGHIQFFDGPWGAFQTTTTTADDRGAFSWSFSVDPARAAGKYVIRAHADDGTEKQLAFYVTGISVAPSTGLAGRANAMTITGAGFKDNDEVLISANPPELFDLQTGRADATGAWTFDVSSDAAARTGIYSITAEGSGGFAASAPFALNSGSAAPFVVASPPSFAEQSSNTAASLDRHLTITNPGTAATSWTTVVGTDGGGNWLSVSPSSGTLDPGASVTLTVRLTAYGLTPSSYGGRIALSPTGGGGGNPQTVTVALQVDQGGAGLVVSPRQMQRGTTQTLNLTGDGYQVGETVRISGPFDPALVPADNRGHVTFQRQLAPDPGAYSVSAIGQTSGVVQTAPFNVTSIDLSSAGLPAGTAGPLLVNAHGWQPYEPVALTVSPAGLIPGAVLTADRDGNVLNWSRALLSTAATGIYTLTLSGEGSGMRMSVPFHILQLGVTPALIDAGQHPVLGIRGYGFTPNGDVSVRGGPFGTFIERADGSGLLVAPEVVNSGRFGSYTLIAYDYGSGAAITTRLDVLGAEASNTYAGGQANLGGGGFVPNEVVQVHATPAGVVEDFTVTADASGNLPGSNFVLLPQAPAGEYALTLKGLASGRQAQASALVLTGGGLAVTPSSSAPGSYPSLALTAQGFQPGEIVDITGDAFGEIEVLADGSGAAHAEMRVTRGDANRFQIQARGMSSQFTVHGIYAQAALRVDGGPALPVGYTGPLVITGTGFEPGATVTISATPAGLFAPTSTVVNGDGAIRVSAHIANAALGDFTIAAVASNSTATVTTWFSVSELRVSPTQYLGGQTPSVSVTADGFQPGELVRVYDDTCGGCLFGNGQTIVADSAGKLSFTFTPPVTDAGIHRLRARGDWGQRDVFASLLVSGVTTPAFLTIGQSNSPTLSVRGFRPRATLGLSSQPPELFGSANAATDDAGALDFALPLNGNPPPGRYHLTANDVSSGFVATADVVLSSASAPVLEIGTTKLLFLAAQGSQQSQSQTFRLRNRGSGTMRWHTNATTASGGGWLSADAGEAFAFSDGLQDRSVFVNPTGLAAGAYDGTILVAADGTDNVPQTIAVHLTVVGVGQATASVTPAFSLASQLAQLTVRGSGFLPNEAVDLSGGGFPPDRVLADVTGRVSVTRPNGIDPGRYDVQLRGVASGLTASATFRRQRWSLGPAAALQGSSANVNFSLSGMLPGEAITLSAAPAGLTAPVIVTADGDGNAQGTFVTDGSAPTGAYTLRAQGSLSGADGAQQQMFSVIQLSASQLQWAASDTKPQLQVNGQGYAPFEWLDVQPRASGPRACGGALPFSDLTLQADASGAFNASPQVDPLTCSGAYAIYVRGHTSAVTLATSVYQTEMDYRYPDNPSVPVRLISPRQATPILVAGFGFGSGERITLSGDTSVLGATSATAGPWGDFQVSVTVSADPGSYSLTARGETTGFRSGPRVLHVGTTGVTPAQWLQGESPNLHIQAQGFQANEQVLVTEGPFEAFSLQADPAGVIDALRRVTVTDQAGRWSLHLHGVQSGVDQRFTLYGTRLSLSRTQATATVATGLQVCWSGFPSSELLQLVSQPAGLLGAANPRTDGDGNGCLDTQLRTDAPPGSYTVRLAGQASGFVVQHDFRLTVPGAPFLTLNTSSFDYALVQGGGPADQWLSIGDASEGTTLTWTATTSTTDAGKWLSISGASGSASLGAPSWILVHVDPAGLGAGIHAHWRRCQ